MRIFLGKFSKTYPDQVEKKYYAAGAEGNQWYGGVKVGDYVFAAHEGMIIGLWRAKEYTKMKNAVSGKESGVLLFEEVKKYNDISVVNDFTRYKYFKHDLNLVNKVTKSVKGLGFIEISVDDNCPSPEDIDFKGGHSNIYIAYKDTDIEYRDRDIRITIDSSEEMNIFKIERYINNEFTIYEELNSLYEYKNTQGEKYSIKELYDYAIEDQATKKQKFLATCIEELESKGYFLVTSAISLYDNLLVGRKRTVSSKSIKDTNENASNSIDSEEVLEVENEQYEEIASLLNFNPNIILYGPPGTGKTFATKQIIELYENKYFKNTSGYENAELEGRVKTVTFHQSYSYEEFIEGIRPVLDGDEDSKLGYRLENGIFKDHCINADKSESKPYYMIIDEINRGNIAKIFGELITLLEQDKRGKLKVMLPYSKKEFTVPNNLIVIGTMNTADRSIAAIDTALRRRFTFVELEPDASVITKYYNPIVNNTIDMVKLLNAINEKIMKYYDRDHRIGHAYFLGIESLSNFYQVWYYKILPLLNEYFYNDIDTIRSIVGNYFIDDYGNSIKLSKDSVNGEISDFEDKIIRIYKGN